MPKSTEANGNSVIFENGARVSVKAVVWAVGYKDDSEWVCIPEVKDAQGNFLHEHGVSPVKNLYFIGRPWQTSRASALIFGVSRDAEIIVKHIMENENDLAEAEK